MSDPGPVEAAPVAARELYVAFQPIVNFQRREIFGYEALLRCRSETNTHAVQVIQEAIAAGTWGQMGRELRDMAVRGCPRTALFLNLHPSEFNEGWLVRPDDAMFYHDEPVYLEITESVPLSHFKHCHGVLREIRGRGISLAIDDLGAGYSNLKYIADLNPEVVKVDRQLIANLRSESRTQKLVTALVKLCDSMNAKVVAEGIETPEELSAVIDTGAHYGQGFLFARPAFPAPAVDWGIQGLRPRRG
ncbi:MAG TPA: EAL domain-containing protein [Candidatus Polarisedimenticolia bacterium]|jgi:EAL domain-containing protein (putative c-di-GMP-specific phosphodiesterase class I)|nr:EAL domain-containing protein [Candidatus Polarisedimenticolia bacterium]